MQLDWEQPGVGALLQEAPRVDGVALRLPDARRSSVAALSATGTLPIAITRRDSHPCACSWDSVSLASSVARSAAAYCHALETASPPRPLAAECPFY